MCEKKDFSGLKDNAMLKVRPDLWDEWDFEKNGEIGLDIYKMTKGSHKISWWCCKKCENSWDAITKDRVLSGQGCPYCVNARVKIGYNDVWATNPLLASQMKYPEDGYKYTEGSSARVDWVCRSCGEEIESRSIGHVRVRGLYCSSCDDGGVSYPERLMFQLLKELEIPFEREKIFEWSGLRRYDFFIASNIIIEMHGEQHYTEGFLSLSNRQTLSEVEENDSLKKKQALDNGINQYIVIDSRESRLNYIRDSITSNKKFLSVLQELGADIEKVDWESVQERSLKTFNLRVWNIWNSGEKSLRKIADALQMSVSSVAKALKRGHEIGKCDYIVENPYCTGKRKDGKRRVVQLSLQGELIKRWDSILDASGGRVSSPLIVACCKTKDYKTHRDYFWRYEDEYDAIGFTVPHKPVYGKSVVQIDLKDKKKIHVWETVSQAEEGSGANSSSIVRVCKNKQKTAGGFKWMYLEDYEKEFGKFV